MKKSLILIAISLFVITAIQAGNGNEGNDEKTAVMFFSKTVHDFGKIKKDNPATASFAFQNTGESPLMILSVKGSCGCTVADYTKGEIPNGQYGEVTATYNAAKIGAFKKTVTVNATSDDGPITLIITGEVVE